MLAVVLTLSCDLAEIVERCEMTDSCPEDLGRCKLLYGPENRLARRADRSIAKVELAASGNEPDLGSGRHCTASANVLGVGVTTKSGVGGVPGEKSFSGAWDQLAMVATDEDDEVDSGVNRARDRRGAPSGWSDCSDRRRTLLSFGSRKAFLRGLSPSEDGATGVVGCDGNSPSLDVLTVSAKPEDRREPSAEGAVAGGDGVGVGMAVAPDVPVVAAL